MGELGLIEVVNALTRETVHRILVEGPDGSEVAKFVRQAPVLGQLRAAIQPTLASKSGGGGGSSAAPFPMSADAYDLMQEIDEEVTQQYWLAKSAAKDSKKSQPLPVELRIQYWAARAHLIQDGADEAAKLMNRWVRDIGALLDPVHRIEVIGPCSKCWATDILVPKDGGVVLTPALTAGWSAAAGAVGECGACGHRWAGFEIHDLVAHVKHCPTWLQLRRVAIPVSTG